MVEQSFLVLTNAAEGREAEYHRWYDEVHLGEVLAVPGFVGARRYRIVPGADGAPPRHHFLAVYEIDCDDPGAALGDLMARVADGRLQMSDAMIDMQASLWAPIGERRTS